MDAVTETEPVRRGGIQPRADWSTPAAAYQLAQEIRDFWKDRGAEVNVHILQLTDDRWAEARSIYCVRSNLVNGLPRGWTSARLGKQQYEQLRSRDADIVG